MHIHVKIFFKIVIIFLYVIMWKHRIQGISTGLPRRTINMGGPGAWGRRYGVLSGMTKEEFIEKCKAVYIIDSMDEDNKIYISGAFT